MENRCKHKKCQKTLPEGYNSKYCENCINERVKFFKDTAKVGLGVAVFVGSAVISNAAKGKNNPKN